MKHAVFAAFLLFAIAATVNADPILDSITITAPASGGKLALIASENGLYAVALDYAGGPLPGENSMEVLVPAPEALHVFAASVVPRDRHWTVPSWPASLTGLPELTEYALWQGPDGKYGAMIVMTGGGMITYLAGRPGGIAVTAASHDSRFAPSRVPLFAMGRGDDPYRLTRDLYAFALAAMRQADPGGVIGKVRWEKPYPEILRYVGWCSWNAHYQMVNAKALLQHGESFKAAGFPMRWMIIDDGWEQTAKHPEYKVDGRDKSLAGFEADPVKFPGGLADVVSKLKKDYGVTWIGVWHTLQGYWDGVDLNTPMGQEYKDALLPVNAGIGVPDPRGDAGKRFWDGYHGFMKDAGVDFVKTDDQSTMYEFTEDLVPISTAYANAQRNYQASAQERFNGNVINCMSMNVDTIYQWATTNVARVSGDFQPLSPLNPRQHVVKSVMNAMWISNLVWPDYDMWQTHKPHSLYHAVARAISGGPVYITDKAGRERFQYLWPLVLKTGELVRVDEPGLPAKKSLFNDPLTSGVPLIAFARSGAAGVLAVWNMDDDLRPEKVALSPADAEGIEGERFAVYEYFSGKMITAGRNEEFPVLLKPWDQRLYSVVPIGDGFAPIGLTNKYVPPATVLEVMRNDNSTMVTLAEAGPFLAYCERKPGAVKVNGEALPGGAISFADNALKLDLSKGGAVPGKIQVEIIW
ncbi:MAG TPA: Sip1-related alpha-galactosidase [bacterium]|nr:Sip1-related alpha-galactosidase [bacterium]